MYFRATRHSAFFVFLLQLSPTLFISTDLQVSPNLRVEFLSLILCKLHLLCCCRQAGALLFSVFSMLPQYCCGFYTRLNLPIYLVNTCGTLIA